MAVLAPPPICAAELARKIASESKLSWDSGDRPIKNLLYKIGCKYGRALCHPKGLPDGANSWEWMLDLVWMDKTSMLLAVESEFSNKPHRMEHRLDDFEKLMFMKAPLKLFIYATRNTTEGEDVRRKLAEYLRDFSQHLEGEEYLLMDVTKGHANFFLYQVPNNGTVDGIEFAPLQLDLSSGAS
jgi:hypothetical protein